MTMARYSDEFTDEQRIELFQRFATAQPALAYSLDFPEKEKFTEVVRINVCHFAAIIYMLFKDRFEMPEVTENDIIDIYKRIESMLNYINGDAESDLEVERLYPEPALLHHVKEFILEHHAYLSPVQHFDMPWTVWWMLLHRRRNSMPLPPFDM
jgi:hypothetical protein